MILRQNKINHLLVWWYFAAAKISKREQMALIEFDYWYKISSGNAIII